MTAQIQLYNTFESHLQELDFHKKNRRRDEKLEDHKVRRLSSDYQNEVTYLWNSGPDRKGKDVYDSGEVDLLNQKYEMDAVRRDMKKNALVRVRTGRYIVWSDFEGKWNDSE